MKINYKEPRIEVCEMLVTGIAQRHARTPFGQAFEAGDPASMRAAHEQLFDGPATGPTGGYFELLIFLARVEGRMNYRPGILIEERFDELLATYWKTRCRLEAGVDTDDEPEPAALPAPSFAMAG